MLCRAAGTIPLPRYHTQLKHCNVINTTAKHQTSTCTCRKTLDKYINIYSTKHDASAEFSLLLHLCTHTVDTHTVCFSDYTTVTHKALQITEEIATISHFSQSLYSVLTPFLPAFQRRKKQFSKLYSCNCPEKMGKMGFFCSLSSFSLFWTGKKSSRHPSLSAKVR